MDSSENPEVQKKAPPKSSPPSRRKKRWHRFVVFLEVVYFTIMFAAIALGIALYATEKGVRVPQWLDGKFQEQIDATFGGVHVTYETAYLKLEKDFRPKMVLNDAAVINAEGEVIARLSQLQAKATRRSVLQRSPKLQTLTATGLYATIRRSTDNRFNWSLSQESTAAVQIPSLQELDLQLENILSIPSLNEVQQINLDPITLRYEDAMTQRAYTADGGRFTIEQANDELTLSGDLTLLSDKGDVSRALVKFTSPLASQKSTLSVDLDEVDLRDLTDQSQYMQMLSPITGRAALNMRSEISSDGALVPINFRVKLEDGTLSLPAQPQIPFEAFQAYFTIDVENKQLEIAEVRLESDLINTSVSARIQLRQDAQSSDVYGTIDMPKLTLSSPILPQGTMALTDISGHFKSRLDSSDFEISALSGRLGGTEATLFSNLNWNGQEIASDITVSGLTHSDLVALWPDDKAPKAKDWVATRPTGAEFGDIDVAVRYTPDPKTLSYFLTVPVRAKTLQYSNKLPRAEDVEGILTIQDNSLSVIATRGRIPMGEQGAIQSQDVRFHIPDLREKPARGQLSATGQAPLTAVTAYLNSEHLSLLDKAKLPQTIGLGHVRADLTLETLLQKNTPRDQIKFHGTAQVSDFSSSTLVAQHTIKSPSLTVDYSDQEATIYGPAQFDALSGSARLSIPFQKDAQLLFKSRASKEALRSLGVNLEFLNMTGEAEVSGMIDFPKGRSPKLQISSDLRGLGLSLPVAMWQKSPRDQGTLNIEATLGKLFRIDRLQAKSGSLSADLSVQMSQGGQLDKVDIAAFAIKPLGHITGTYRPNGSATPQLILSGGQLDIRPLIDGQGRAASGGPSRKMNPLALQGRLDRLIVHDKMTLHKAEMSAKNIAQQLTVQGLLGGIASTRATVLQLGERIEVTAPNAGRVLDAMNVTTQVKNGELRLALERNAARNGYDGALKVERFQLLKAPVLANILNAVSIIGVLEQLNGEGIHFGALDANFSISPDKYALHDMSAVGASMGMSLRGIVNREDNTLNMDGVVSPFYFVNAIGAPVSRKGEGLFGVTFAIDGPSAAPKVSVNPLSLLTPGPLRELFRKQIDTTE